MSNFYFKSESSELKSFLFNDNKKNETQKFAFKKVISGNKGIKMVYSGETGYLNFNSF